jgi:hypothetical protein
MENHQSSAAMCWRRLARARRHHERFVETVAIQLSRTTVLNVNHRRLTERRQQFVRGMSGEH